jgi:hypothetical protein
MCVRVCKGDLDIPVLEFNTDTDFSRGTVSLCEGGPLTREGTLKLRDMLKPVVEKARFISDVDAFLQMAP